MKKNKIHSSYLLLMLSALVFFSSCSLKQNICLNGVTLWHTHKKIKKTELEKFVPVEQKEEVETIVLLPEKVNSPETAQEKFLAPKNKIAGTKEYSTKKKGFSFHLPKNKNPDPPKSRFKVSVSQINTIAFISFLFVPIFIVSLFTGPGFFVLSSFLIGVILATIAGFLADGRKGCWLVGIAIGFWIVITGYMALLLFVF